MDLLQFEKDMPPEAKQIQNTLAKIARKHNLIKKCNEWWHAESFPKEDIIAILQEGELMRMDTAVDDEYGCQKVSYLTYGLFAEALEAIDSGLRSFLPSVTKGLVRYAIYSFGSEEQKQKYLPLLADGSSIGCFALTGANGGSDPKWMNEHARIDGNNIIFNGDKKWITNGSIADLTVVWMQTGDIGNPKTIRGFIVERGAQGFAQDPIKNKAGLRVSDTGNLSFGNEEDCIVNVRNALLPETEIGLGAAYQCLNQARFTIGWGVIGVAKECFKEALRFETTRMIRDDYDTVVPLSSAQLMQAYNGEIGSRIVTMEARAWRIANLIDKKGMITRDLAPAISFLKWKNVEDAKYVVNECRRILASSALQIEGTNQTLRHHHNLDVVETYEGTPEMHSFIAGNYFINA